MKQLIDDIEGLLIFFFVVIFPLFYLFQNTWRSYEYHKELERRGVTVKARLLIDDNIQWSRSATEYYYVYMYNGELDTGSYVNKYTRLNDYYNADTLRIAYEKPIIDIVFLPEFRHQEVVKVDLFCLPCMMFQYYWPFFSDNCFWLTVLAITFIIYISLGLYAFKRDREKNGSIPPSSD